MAAFLSVLTVFFLFISSSLCEGLLAIESTCEPATITEYLVQDVYVSTYIEYPTTFAIGPATITATNAPALILGHIYLTSTFFEVVIGYARGPSLVASAAC
jgi:hypothetical protein